MCCRDSSQTEPIHVLLHIQMQMFRVCVSTNPYTSCMPVHPINPGELPTLSMSTAKHGDAGGSAGAGARVVVVVVLLLGC